MFSTSLPVQSLNVPPQVRWLRCGGQSARRCGRCVRPTPCPCRCIGTTTSTTSGGTLEAGYQASTRPETNTHPASSASPTPVGKLFDGDRSCYCARTCDWWSYFFFLFVFQLAAVGRPGHLAPNSLMWSVMWSSTINWTCGSPPKAQSTIIKVLLTVWVLSNTEKYHSKRDYHKILNYSHHVCLGCYRT